MENKNTRQRHDSAIERIKPCLVAFFLGVVATFIFILFVWGDPTAKQQTAQTQTPKAKGHQTTFRPVLPTTHEGNWVATDDRPNCRLAIAFDEGSDGAKGTVVCRTGPADVAKGAFRIKDTRITFDFGKKLPIYWDPEIRGHGTEFEFFVTNDDRLILIAPPGKTQGTFQGQVYPFKREP